MDRERSICSCVIEYHNALGILADICQILSIPLAVWLAHRSRKESLSGGTPFLKKILINRPYDNLNTLPWRRPC